MFHTKLITDKFLRHPNIIWYDCSVRSALGVRMCQVFTNSPFSLCVDDDDDDVAYAFLMRWTRSIVVAIILSHLITLNLVSGVCARFCCVSVGIFFYSMCLFFTSTSFTYYITWLLLPITRTTSCPFRQCLQCIFFCASRFIPNIVRFCFMVLVVGFCFVFASTHFIFHVLLLIHISTSTNTLTNALGEYTKHIHFASFFPFIRPLLLLFFFFSHSIMRI